MKRLFELSLTALLAVCCTAVVLEDPAVGTPDSPAPDPDMLVLGRRLEDPYSVENMTKALEAVYPTKASRVPVPTTHYYVRFLPANEQEYDMLEGRGIHLLDHPMDYEIVREGDWYHDPEVPEGKITWQYAAVPKDKPWPRVVRYEILHECHIPDDAKSTKSADGIDWAAVEREAFRLTGNGALLEENLTKANQEESTPAGRITIVDPKRGGEPEGVRGVHVTCNLFVKVASAYTDEDGRYRMTRSFSGKPRYRIVFKNSAGFCIGFNLLLVPASVSSLGVGEATGLDVQIDRNSDRRLFSRSVVSNAGYDYIHRCGATTPSLKAPPSNLRLWLFQGLDVSCSAMLQQGALIDNGPVGKLLGIYAILLKIFLPDIMLGLKDRADYADIYAEATHAFAHASHFMLAGKDYWDHYVRFLIRSFVTSGFTVYGTGTEEDHGYCEVSEMWAFFFQTILYRERYGAKDLPQFGYDKWFHPQILLQLEEKGLDANRIYQVLGEDVTDREMLQKKLTSYYPEFKSAINEAFARYN